jgi:hypothetical protein
MHVTPIFDSIQLGYGAVNRRPSAGKIVFWFEEFREDGSLEILL